MLWKEKENDNVENQILNKVKRLSIEWVVADNPYQSLWIV